MKRNLNIELKTLSGETITESGKPVTLATIAVNALLMPFDDEPNLSGEDKVKRYKLAQQIHGAEADVELMAEDIALLKKLIGKGYLPIIVGQAYEILEAEAACRESSL